MIKKLFFAWAFMFLLQSIGISQSCCCGGVNELVFPGFDFEIPPFPKPGLDTTYCGGNFGPWVITKGCIDLVDPDQYNVGWGNPNGKSHFIDLNKPTNNAATIQYTLTGLIPGSSYKIEWYYAKFYIEPANIVANCKIGNGAWLNVTWKSTNHGDIIWLKQSHNFTALASTTTLEFSDAGSTSPWPSGMLIDDIKIYGCVSSNDTEAPVIQNPPVSAVVDCEDQVPLAPQLIITDNCDTSPVVKFTEVIEIRPPCKRFVRDWIITDNCGNVTTAKQIIDILDNEPPVVHNPPPDVTVTCIKDIPPQPKLDITDNCKVYNVVFSSSIQKGIPCRKIFREWKIYDGCGINHETIVTQTIDVDDQEPPIVRNPPVDLVIGCEIDTPAIPRLIIEDNCDPTPSAKFSEARQVINACTKKITRIWTMMDSCANTSTQTQVIDIIDEAPVINDPPQDVTVACDFDIPDVPKLDISDNCSSKPMVAFKETVEATDPCNKHIKREWNITDACGNTNAQIQLVNVVYKTPPQFTKLPLNLNITCDKDIKKEFSDWIKKNGNAEVTDACLTVTWRAIYDFPPKLSCDSVLVEFVAKDHCDNESSQFAYFIVTDTDAPSFITKAVSKNYVCIPNTRDSLREWLRNFGYLKMRTDCDTVILSSNFDGDSTKNPMKLTFYAKDRCGNIDSCRASFSYRSDNDTLRNTQYSCSILRNYQDTSHYFLNGCDSIVIVQHIKKNPDSIYIQINTCDINQKPFDTIRMVNQDACDSTLFYEIKLKPSPVTHLQIKDCSYQNYTIDTAILAGQYCDSTVITERIPLRKDINRATVFTCDQSKADTSLLHLINTLGCDSLVTVYTIYIPNLETHIQQKICGLKQAYTDTVIYQTGLCDSLVITTHDILPVDSIHLVSTTCDPSKAGIFSSTLRNQFGCDSVVIQNVQLNRSDSIFISKTTCTYSASGIAIQKLKNIFGCDSIVKTTTVFIPSDTIQIKRKSCDFAATGTKTTILKGRQCDSVIITTTTFVPSDTITIKQITCNPANAKVDTLYYSNMNHCDSIIYRSIVFIPSDTTKINMVTCDLNSAGIKTKILKGNPCDSVIITTTAFVPSDTTQITQISCDPAETGLKKTVLQNRNGCDSLILQNTIYAPLKLKYELDSISCYNQNDGYFKITNTSDFGKPYELFLNNIKLVNQDQINNLSPGSYHIFIRDQKGCITDSIAFTLTNPDEFTIDLGNDLVVDRGTKIYLNLKSNRNLQSVTWNPSNSNCTNCTEIHLTINEDTWVYTQAVDDRHCIQLDSIFIRVKNSDKVFAPNSFSPNGDNINDYFYIYGPDKAIVEYLLIYDRWGEKVFETRNVPINVPTAGWNGAFNGQKMNPGVFVYYAKVRIDDDVIELKGDLTLIR